MSEPTNAQIEAETGKLVDAQIEDFELAQANLDRSWVLPDGTMTGLDGLLAWATTQPAQTVYLSTDADTPNRAGWKR